VASWKEQVGGVRKIAAVDFAKALWRWYELCEKYFVKNGRHAEET
jgi:hypothetical protein